MIATNKDFQDYFEDKITKYLNDIKITKYRETAGNGTEQRHSPEGSDCHPPPRRIRKRSEKTSRSGQTPHGDGPSGA